jgi:hypothetical protein
MAACVDSFRNSTSRRARIGTALRQLCCGKCGQTGTLTHRRNQVTNDSSTVADVREHHAFPHRPRVISTDKTDQAVVAVFAACRMGGIHGFTFNEETIELRDNKSWLTVIVAELEKEIRCLC